MNYWLHWLKGFFLLGAVDPDAGDGGDPAPDPALAGGGDPDPDPDLNLGADPDLAPDPGDLGGDGGDPAPRKSSAETIRELQSARQAAEEEARRSREEAEALRRGPIQAPLSDDQRRFEAEERELSDSKIDPNRKWQIESNRVLRANTRASTDALFRANDISDKTGFDALSVTKPKLHKQYSQRVEDELAKIRKAGNNAPRMGILQFLIGGDAINGKLAAARPAAQPQPQPGASRGQLPGARSDVTGKERATQRQARAKRLENIQL